MNNQYVRLQAVLNSDIDQDLIKHLEAVRREFPTFKSQADVIRHILERDRQVARVHSPAWNWRDVLDRTPPWMDKILAAIERFDGRARVVIEDKENPDARIEFGEGLFEE